MPRALRAGMKAKKLEDLQVYNKALDGIIAVSPLLTKLQARKDFKLADQLSESSSNIPGHIAEGFGQSTDRHFAKYLGIARGSAQETRGHLAAALAKEHISQEEERQVSELYLDLCNMLTAFIDYLRRSDYDDRW
jgi:four helix bundle protein